MNVNLNGDGRVADLERQVRELKERLALLESPRIPAAQDTMCGSCRATLLRGGSPVCGCTTYGPKIMCAVA